MCDNRKDGKKQGGEVIEMGVSSIRLHRVNNSMAHTGRCRAMLLSGSSTKRLADYCSVGEQIKEGEEIERNTCLIYHFQFSSLALRNATSYLILGDKHTVTVTPTISQPSVLVCLCVVLCLLLLFKTQTCHL